MIYLDDCALCDQKADPRCGVYDRDGNVYALCDACAPDANQRDTDRVVAKCIARGTTVSLGRPRFWAGESAYATGSDGFVAWLRGST